MTWPRWMLALSVRLRAAALARQAERDLDDELAFHLEMQARTNMQKGLNESEARLRAARSFGGVDQSKERCRDLRPLAWLDSSVGDLRYALRTFRRSPGFVVGAILVLGVGIGANTAMFSLLNGLLFRPLPVPAAEDLRYVHTVWARWPDTPQDVPFKTFSYLGERRDVFAGVALSAFDFAKIGSGVQPQRVSGERVSANYFDVLQVRPALGRAFIPSDDLPGASPVLVVSDWFWRRFLNRSPTAIGSTVDLRESQPGYYSAHHRVYTVVGVMPPGFDGISDWVGPAQYWAPIRQRATDHHDASVEDFGGATGGPWEVEDRMEGAVICRLKPGVSDAQVTPVVRAAEGRLRVNDQAGSMRRENRSLLCEPRTASARLLPFRGARAGRGPVGMALMLVSTAVLLIGATNLTGLLLARGVLRRPEIAARLALGAGRARILRQALTESLLLSVGGTAAALCVARLLIAVFTASASSLSASLSAGAQATSAVPIDLRALLFTAGLGAAVGILIGLAPALQLLKTDVVRVLAGGAAPATTARSRALRWVLIPQISLSLVLLLVAGVLVRSLVRTEFAERGREPEKVLQATFLVKRPPLHMRTDDERRRESERRREAFTRMLDGVRQLPNVENAAVTDQPGLNLMPVSVASRSGQNRWAGSATVSPGYFETMGIPIVRGRAFDGRDKATATPVAIVCERLAEQLWPGEEAVGQYIAEYHPKTRRVTSDWRLVIGIAGEVKRPGEEDLTTYSFFVPQEQSRGWASALMVRGRVTGQEVKQAVLSAVEAADVGVEVNVLRTLVEEIDRALYPRRLAAAILALSGFLGLLLSSMGLYGIVSYSAAQRLREIGVRTALGAGHRDVVRLLLRDGTSALAIGTVFGIGAGLGAMRIVSSMVVGLPAIDPVALAAVPILLGAVVLAAGMAPARRAARSSPIDVLRGL